MDLASNAFKTSDLTTDASVLALSWKIATEPKLYQRLAPNPYSSVALQIISERFPDANLFDVIRAVVLAEPEGKYDRNFRQQTLARQEEELSKQKEISTEINKRLVQHCKIHATEVNRLPKEFVYDSLSKVVFETTDLQEVEQKYAQNQRRDFRLLIINFIQDTHTQKPQGAQKDNVSLSAVVASDKKLTSATKLYTKSKRSGIKVAFAAFSLVLLFYIPIWNVWNINQHLQTKEHVLGIEAQEENQGLPVRLKIPKLNIDAVIQHVGVTPKGEMEVPSNTLDVGWFDPGTRPGEKGSAVIAGHFDGKNGKAGVFSNLNKLKTGDKLFVEDSKGTSIAFVVRERRIYPPGYADVVFSLNDSAHLNLVTCDGVWDKAKKSYSKRLVLFADIVR